jgi:tetratricopeptide (TPR) repeat protein
MSRGLGQLQLAILRVLARYEAGGESTLTGLRIEEIANHLGDAGEQSASLCSSTRRALARMSSTGLVNRRYYPHLQGQPRAWKITDTGMMALERRGFTLDVAVVLVYRASTHRRRQRYKIALEYLDHAVGIAPSDFRAIADRGETHRVMGHYSQAVTDFTRALELDQADAWALTRRGLAHRAMKQYPEAISDLTRAIDCDPDSSWIALAGRGEAYRLMGKHGEAIIDLSRSIEIKPDYLWAVERLSLAHRRAERFTEAIAALTRAIKLKPDNRWAIVERGEIYGLLGRYKEAIADLGHALKLDPSQGDVRLKYNKFRAQLMEHRE